ncbi:helix-turn-helix domain-containing protein [Planctomonas sp. JC2975]|uniref:GlxA family transcriptional regulator n=1 Tax=Planctomonas sp. JC2975 TaxID=2729626 RepID=UPI0014734601|nr:helix-turn-helix domain-containing protein [Planctomonas sp. JC2975]NNC13268.1 helix-turn-helix domain-containing protein [Planctomonas sp. JC2975]
MLRSVAVPVIDDLAIFEFGLFGEVFGLDRSWYTDIPPIDFRVCGVEAGRPVTTQIGVPVTPAFDLTALDDADVIAVPAATIRPDDAYPPELLDALRRASARGAIMLSACSGAFVLGAAGLLDGRPCTTHWRYADELQRRHPTARVDEDVLFVDDGDIVTSAGTAAGIDASLHLVRRELGSEVANVIARNMVVPPQRDGGQRQYIPRPVPEADCDELVDVLAYMNDHLDQQHSVAVLAQRAHMSTRTFARRFVAETGVTPMQWLTGQRVLHARLLLETTDAPIDEIAAACGFGSGTLFRHHFAREVGVAPTAYRRSFAGEGTRVGETTHRSSGRSSTDRFSSDTRMRPAPVTASGGR